MRLMRLAHPHTLEVRAAHCRIVRPGDVVDFDEAVHPAGGANYSFETALGPADAAKFEPVPVAAPEPEPEPDSAIEDAEPIDDETPQARRKKKR